ncbi:MAG: glycerol kinase [Acidimicrobiia bacterium]|nr:glycerol kinase [Acidimicrobiia bacterium]MYC58212.1 glycerol kinase [Acidimicrobiia bacterium]MYG93644.1 glycerol kinase [Acidimicrobiia bacterium]MYI30317.1 glycerol kinase [Acidimicrobiia bacterium]
MNICVIDVGTSSIRAAITDGQQIICFRQTSTPPMMPEPGLVEFDAQKMAAISLQTASEAIAEAGGVEAVAVTNQRGATVMWDRQTSDPVGPGLSWQDLRTVGDCLRLKDEGLELSPSEAATKVAYLLNQHDSDRTRNLCFGTVDSWIVWCLSQGANHVIDPSNASMSGLTAPDGSSWSTNIAAQLGVPMGCLPKIVDSTAVVGRATALPGAPPIAGIIGDQQSSLIGQRCVLEGLAKLTFGTGAFLDVCASETRPIPQKRSDAGLFAIVAWQHQGAITWGTEAMMITAGSNINWLTQDMGLLTSASEAAEMASSVDDTGGVVYVPALYGLGTPYWDFGARGALLGITGGTKAAHVVRAVLEGVAHRSADLLNAAETDNPYSIESIRVDGGMSQNPVFTQILADTLERPVELCPVPEGTTLGAALLAQMALGYWSNWEEMAASWSPRAVIEPHSTVDRARWLEAIQRATRWYPELSDLGL